MGTITETKTNLRKILKERKIGYWLRGPELDYVVSLLTLNHPRADEKIGCGIKGIRIKVMKPWNVRGFELIRIDNSKTDFSYLKIIGSKMDRARLDRYAAFRTAIRKQVNQFKENFFNSHSKPVCPVTFVPLTWQNSQVDHYPVRFIDIVAEWLEKRGLKLGEIQVIGYADGQTTKRLSDPELEHNFIQFHSDHATLRVIEAKANMAGPRGRQS